MSISSFSITQKMIEGTVETVLLFSSVTSIIFLDKCSSYFHVSFWISFQIRLLILIRNLFFYILPIANIKQNEVIDYSCKSHQIRQLHFFQHFYTNSIKISNAGFKFSLRYFFLQISSIGTDIFLQQYLPTNHFNYIFPLQQIDFFYFKHCFHPENHFFRYRNDNHIIK